MSRGASTGKPYPNVQPAAKSLKKIKAKLTELTQRNLTVIPLSDVVGNVNRSLRGWANYFHYRNSSDAMSKVRQHAEDRLRTHLMKRHKVKERKTALRRFPRRDLYERYGLYKVPTVAGLAGMTQMTARIVSETFSEIAKNLQKYVPRRSRPRPKRPKPHKFFGQKPVV